MNPEKANAFNAKAAKVRNGKPRKFGEDPESKI